MTAATATKAAWRGILLLVAGCLVGLGEARGDEGGDGRPLVLDNGDTNGDGRRDLSDAVGLLNWLFSGGPPPVDIVPPGTGDTETILPFAMRRGTLPNPAAPIVRAIDPEVEIDEELEYYFYCPPGARAVAYVFHGGEGSALTWLKREEEAALLADLVREGYAVVLPESSRRPTLTVWFVPDPDRFLPEALDPWVNAVINADEVVIRTLHRRLGFDETTPVALVGFSSGGKFASAMAYSLQLPPPADLGDYYYDSPRTAGPGGLNVRAGAIYSVLGLPYYFGHSSWPTPLAEPYSTPTILNHNAFDDKNAPADVAAGADYLASIGVPVERNLSEPRSLQPDRLARVLGVSLAESRWVFAELRREPLVMDAGGLLLPAADLHPVLDRFSEAKRAGIQSQFKVLRAEHTVMSHFHDETIAFFETHIAP